VRAALLLALAACGAPAPAAAPVSYVAQDSYAWLGGSWSGPLVNLHWQRIGDAMWGVAINASGGFEVHLLRADKSMIVVENGKNPTYYTTTHANAQEIELAGASQHRLRFVKTAAGYRGELLDSDGKVAVAFDEAPANRVAAPELEQLDRDFAAKSAAEGGSAWAQMFAPDGAEWSNGKRIEQADVGQVMGGVLLGATMEWKPVASGKHGDVGFTLGTYTLQSKRSAEHESGSYCTIWRQQPDGSWKIVFDIGSRTEK